MLGTPAPSIGVEDDVGAESRNSLRSAPKPLLVFIPVGVVPYKPSPHPRQKPEQRGVHLRWPLDDHRVAGIGYR